jgi:hypothetical protein
MSEPLQLSPRALFLCPWFVVPALAGSAIEPSFVVPALAGGGVRGVLVLGWFESKDHPVFFGIGETRTLMHSELRPDTASSCMYPQDQTSESVTMPYPSSASSYAR